MAVPDRTDFNLQNVVDEIDGVQNSLQDCVDDAVTSGYDTRYFSSPATSLLEFRNYSAVFIPEINMDINYEGDQGYVWYGPGNSSPDFSGLPDPSPTVAQASYVEISGLSFPQDITYTWEITDRTNMSDGSDSNADPNLRGGPVLFNRIGGVDPMVGYVLQQTMSINSSTVTIPNPYTIDTGNSSAAEDSEFEFKFTLTGATVDTVPAPLNSDFVEEGLLLQVTNTNSDRNTWDGS